MGKLEDYFKKEEEILFKRQKEDVPQKKKEHMHKRLIINFNKIFRDIILIILSVILFICLLSLLSRGCRILERKFLKFVEHKELKTKQEIKKRNS